MKFLASLIAGTALMFAVGANAEESDRNKETVRSEMEDARRELAEAARRVAELSQELGEGIAWHFRTDAPRRAMLGVSIGEADKDGVEVLSVTPGGPAEKAGLQAGDRIMAIRDVDLLKAEQPTQTLLKTLGEIEPGTEVALTYRRDKNRLEAKVLTEERPRHFRFLRPGQGVDAPRMPRPPMPPGFGALFHGLGDMELVSLSPELGEYFGTREGLLVVRAPKHDEMKLRDGDVITRIGDRAPTDAGHAIRILRSYQPGETVKVDIVRKRKKMTLDVVLPEPRAGMLDGPVFEKATRFMFAPDASPKTR